MSKTLKQQKAENKDPNREYWSGIGWVTLSEKRKKWTGDQTSEAIFNKVGLGLSNLLNDNNSKHYAEIEQIAIRQENNNGW